MDHIYRPYAASSAVREVTGRRCISVTVGDVKYIIVDMMKYAAVCRFARRVYIGRLRHASLPPQ